MFCICGKSYSQQDMDVHLVRSFLTGKKILKAKRDFYDPYLWVLADNNEVYRINSIDYTVDDFTSKFADYHYHFIDIAGRSKDTVFVTGNVGVVIEYKKGIIKEISGGVPGKVNSIGMTGPYNYSVGAKTELQIATEHGTCAYNYKTEALQGAVFNLDGKILESTYRTKMYHNIDKCVCDPASVQKYGVTDQPANRYGGELYLGGNFYGNEVKTAYFTSGNAYRPDGQVQDNGFQYWATETGLFVNRFSDSRSVASPLEGHYLDAKNISKITSIYGMLGFGTSVNSTYVKENILVGTSDGLYFSNSKYQIASSLNYNFYYCSELGNKAINDICVNANTYLKPTATSDFTFCEDGIWVSANDGLYLLKPDYAPYNNLIGKLPAIAFDGSDIAVTDLQTCSPVNVKTTLTPFFLNNQLGVQWFKNGQALTGETNTSLTITDAGEYNAILYDPCNAEHMETNHLTVTTSAAPVIAFNYPDKIDYCFGSTATLSTTNIANYLYRWYKDGILNGNTTASLNTTQAGKYKLEVNACGANWIPTKEVQIDFIKVPQPVVTTNQVVYCEGSTALLSASLPAIDASTIINWQPYQYQWFKDGVLITGSTSSTLNVTQQGKYKVEITSCTGNTATSDELRVPFFILTGPTITPDKTSYCQGAPAVLGINFIVNALYTITWFHDGVAMAQNKDKDNIAVTEPGLYTVRVSSTLIDCGKTSPPYALVFETPPTFTLDKITTTTLCSGQTVDLRATYSGGAVKWSTGETGDQISVKQSATYTATLKTVAGCEVSKDINMQFLPNPAINVPDATLCQFTNQTLTLTAPAGFAKYQWNGQTGTSYFSTSQLGKLTLTVTDSNGCTATQTINITSRCDDIHLPNAFTPNGDGINDTWIIAGLQGDLTTTVKIFNRYGENVFQSTGYAVSWNGTLDGKKLPAGVYYYIISAQASNKVINGTVTIIY
ncbi:MAG: gliding motility-associated C-terminal domain-containing protein [Bacteroidota bacterium]